MMARDVGVVGDVARARAALAVAHLAHGGQLLEDVVHVDHVRAVVLAQPVLDLPGRGHRDLDVAPEGEAQVLDHLRVEGIEQDGYDGGAGLADGQRTEQARRAAGDQPLDFHRHLVFSQVDEIRADGLGDGPVVQLLIGDAIVGHHLRQGLAGIGDLVQKVVRLGALDDALVDEKVEDLLVGSHCRGGRGKGEGTWRPNGPTWRSKERVRQPRAGVGWRHSNPGRGSARPAG